MTIEYFIDKQSTTLSTNTIDRQAGTSAKTTYGWECPRCRQINAPWMNHCNCAPEEKSPSRGEWNDPRWATTGSTSTHCPSCCKPYWYFRTYFTTTDLCQCDKRGDK